ncbi:MAG: membrane protein insertase YidC [Gammaproteobacteria bacterium]|nr:membrane protein insertase YidC [Gammaproteobacteria bacterium]
MENVRLILIVALAMLGLMIWEAWQADYGPQAVEPAPLAASSPAHETPVPNVPTPPTTEGGAMPDVQQAAAAPAAAAAQHVTVTTDLLELTLSTAGGTIDDTELRAYPVDPKVPDVGVRLFQDNPPKVYLFQGGLAGNVSLPTHHDLYTVERDDFRLADGAEQLVVPLRWRSPEGVEVEKRYVFTRGSYLVDVQYVVTNSSGEAIDVHRYEQLKRNEESSRQGMVYTFTGPVLSTPEKRFKKFDFDDLEEAPIDLSAANAWVGIIQHYFVAALLPPADQTSKFYSKILPDKQYLVGLLGPQTTIAPGASATLSSRLYVGPKRHDLLQDIAPGLELTVDFGKLWFIAKPLFLVLKFIHDKTGNWGWGIILLTLMLKLLFYPLSAAGYRSMANMRRVQPRLLALRDRYADDKAQLNQQMMKLYKEEKINPLGGCLPIVVQIPVFIALYWVLLETVEMRQAPFILWITDLSARDPMFVLPLLMGVSMFIQQKLNPAPMDPTQAKVMQILPVVFTVFFAFFPAGLVLYWLVNNILSIAQQWHITRSIESGAK